MVKKRRIVAFDFICPFKCFVQIDNISIHYQAAVTIKPPSIYNKHAPHPLLYFIAAAAAASAALFCCMAWCSANLKPTLCVILIYLLAQFSKQVVSYLSSDLEWKDEMHVPKQRSTSVLYILCCWVGNFWDWCVSFGLIAVSCTTR